MGTLGGHWYPGACYMLWAIWFYYVWTPFSTENQGDYAMIQHEQRCNMFLLDDEKEAVQIPTSKNKIVRYVSTRVRKIEFIIWLLLGSIELLGENLVAGNWVILHGATYALNSYNGWKIDVLIHSTIAIACILNGVLLLIAYISQMSTNCNTLVSSTSPSSTASCPSIYLHSYPVRNVQLFTAIYILSEALIFFQHAQRTGEIPEKYAHLLYVILSGISALSMFYRMYVIQNAQNSNNQHLDVLMQQVHRFTFACLFLRGLWMFHIGTMIYLWEWNGHTYNRDPKSVYNLHYDDGMTIVDHQITMVYIYFIWMILAFAFLMTGMKPYFQRCCCCCCDKNSNSARKSQKYPSVKGKGQKYTSVPRTDDNEDYDSLQLIDADIAKIGIEMDDDIWD